MIKDDIKDDIKALYRKSPKLAVKAARVLGYKIVSNSNVKTPVKAE